MIEQSLIILPYHIMVLIIELIGLVATGCQEQGLVGFRAEVGLREIALGYWLFLLQFRVEIVLL